MQRRYRILILLLMAGVFLRYATRPVDLPDTSFDMSHAPVNLATLRLARFRIGRSANDALLMPDLCSQGAACVVKDLVLGATAIPRQRHSHSLQKLLCVFLI